MICLFVQTTTNTNNIQYTLYVFRFRPKTIKPTERNNKMKSNLQRRKHANQGTTTKQRENSKKVVRKFKQNGRKWERKKFFFIVFQSIFFFFWLNEKFHLQLSRIFYFVEFSMWVCVCVPWISFDMLLFLYFPASITFTWHGNSFHFPRRLVDGLILNGWR